MESRNDFFLNCVYILGDEEENVTNRFFRDSS